ncbi:MAG: sugar transferase [Ignavibacteriae bacterium]|nr:sugar transferase [Ignavibacteriota bacterium]
MNLSEAFHQKVDITKRVIDLVGSLVLIALLSPVFVITVFAILIESGPPMIFKQKRSLCRGGRSFDFYKFRSMVHGADGMKGHLQKYNESDGALFKIKNDPRITRVGKIIRRLSIDELPQLFNVLKGDMSLVGPRPLPVSDLERIQEDWNILRNMKARARAKPGVTGLWQVCGRSALGFNTMIKLDLYYIENQSFLLDMKILLRTIPAVLRGDGAC